MTNNPTVKLPAEAALSNPDLSEGRRSYLTQWGTIKRWVDFLRLHDMPKALFKARKSWVRFMRLFSGAEPMMICSPE